MIVPSWSKSAGTVIALSSSEIVLGLNSELGPIDPQFQFPGIVIPADILANDPSQPFHIQKLARMAAMRMRELAFLILKKGMMSGSNDAAINVVLDKISSASGYKSHGAVIDYEEAKSLGLSVRYLSHNDDLWKRIWLLYCMYDFDTKAEGFGRVIEEDKLSISRPK